MSALAKVREGAKREEVLGSVSFCLVPVRDAIGFSKTRFKCFVLPVLCTYASQPFGVLGMAVS